MKMVWTCPDVNKYQCPEMHNGKSIGIDRAFCLFRHKVIHHPEKRCCEEKPDGIMPVPPLHHRILHSGIHGIGFHETDRNGHAVEHMQQGNSYNVGAEKPVGHINMFHLTAGNGAKKDVSINHPYQRNQYIDWSFKFGIFLGRGIGHGECDYAAKRLNVSQGISKFNTGQASCAAIKTPTAMPTIPQMIVMMANWRTTL